jgi:hypothetical protein
MFFKFAIRLVLTLVLYLININGNLNRFETSLSSFKFLESELLYDNVWGTIYNAEVNQCDSSPTVTGDGSKINPTNASDLRWIAISQDMLNLPQGLPSLKDTSINIFKGKISYGDTIWIESSHAAINGWWVVRDAKHPRVKNSIDFLQTKGDKSLYNYNNLWSGKFLNIKIFKLNYYKYSTYKK